MLRALGMLAVLPCWRATRGATPSSSRGDAPQRSFRPPAAPALHRHRHRRPPHSTTVTPPPPASSGPPCLPPQAAPNSQTRGTSLCSGAV